jgi:hypothetical protein
MIGGALGKPRSAHGAPPLLEENHDDVIVKLDFSDTHSPREGDEAASADWVKLADSECDQIAPHLRHDVSQ